MYSKSQKFLLIISIYIIILFNNNNSEQFDSNPCKNFEAMKAANTSTSSMSIFDLVKKMKKMENCECVVGDGGNFSLRGCTFFAFKNVDKEKMVKLTKRFRILDSLTMRNSEMDKNLIVRNFSLADGPFFDDYYGPIPINGFNCSSMANESIEFCGTNSARILRTNDSNLQPCPNCPPCLVGKWPMNKTEPNNWAEIEAKYSNVKNASWKPKECTQKRMRIAIVIPHRNRTAHLKMLLNNLHTFLQKQQADYRIFVADQAYPEDGTKDKFNRAKLFNAAFMEIRKREIWGENETTDCYIFHDVDLVPDFDTNIYRCDQHGPIRLYSAGDEWGYVESGDRVVGGICSQTGQQFVNANGFSNVFWGWGSEDEDMRERYRASNQPVEFVKSPLGYYSSLENVVKPEDPTNPKISSECDKKLKAWRQKCWKIDGLKNLDYKFRGIEYNKLYTNISIDVLMEKSRIEQPHPCGDEINQKGTFRKTFVKYKHSNLDLKDMQNIEFECTKKI